MFIVGIDLGTNNTVLSYYDSGHLHIIEKAIPSIVLLEDNKVIIGDEVIGNKNSHKNLKRRLTNNPKLLSLYTAFLSKIKEKIDLFILEHNELDYQVVVTVPAYFSESDKDITKRAVLGANLPLLRLLSEPTAAGITYGHFYHTMEEIVLVFDMGAGTTDLTLMRKSTIKNEDNNENEDNNFYEVISLMGDVKFGGEDITKLLRKKLPLEIDAEKSKILLSSGDIPEMKQKEYFDLLEIEYLEKINLLFDKILFDGNLTIKDINQVILVGGSTKNPFIRKTVENYFKKDLNFLIDPDTAVSFGATIYGNSLVTKTNNVVLIDRLPISIGVEVENGKYAKLIERGNIIPTKKESYFTTQEDDQEFIEIKIYQGEHHYIKDNLLIGEFKVMIEPRPKCTPKIKVTSEINADGILTITAIDGTNKESLSIRTNRNNNIERFSTILPHELYEEEFELYYNLFSGMKQQILFQLTENIYLKIDSETRENRLNKFLICNEKVDDYLLAFPRLFMEKNDEETIKNLNLETMEENIIGMKKIVSFLGEEYGDYLNNYELENTKTDWKKKIETIIENIDNYNLTKDQYNRILELAEIIVENDNQNCEVHFNEIDDLLGFNS